MILDDFKNLLLTVDPKVQHYGSTQKGNYTVWQEYGFTPLMNNNRMGDKRWRIQVDRFTKIENDPIADALMLALDTDEITYSYTVDYEANTGYIHHIFDCEVI